MVDGGGLVIGADFIGVGVFFGDGLYDLIKGLLVPAFVFLLVERGGEVGGASGDAQFIGRAAVGKFGHFVLTLIHHARFLVAEPAFYQRLLRGDFEGAIVVG